MVGRSVEVTGRMNFTRTLYFLIDRFWFPLGGEAVSMARSVFDSACTA
jgi:hypothetical protein